MLFRLVFDADATLTGLNCAEATEAASPDGALFNRLSPIISHHPVGGNSEVVAYISTSSPFVLRPPPLPNGLDGQQDIRTTKSSRPTNRATGLGPDDLQTNWVKHGKFRP